HAAARARRRRRASHHLGLAPDDDEYARAHAVAPADEGHHGHGRGCRERRADQGQALCDRLMDLAWSRREAFLYKGAPLTGQIAHARTLGEGPVVLVDHGDNTASGGTQDVMSVIAEVMRQGLHDVVAGPICDPTSVARIIDAGTAASVTLPV